MSFVVGEHRLRTVLSVDEARARLIAAAPAPRAKSVALTKAHHRVLLQPVVAPRDQPPFDASAMDGYAVAALPEKNETLTVIGESLAGRAFQGPVATGEAVRIFTGAPMPNGATRVIVQEDVQLGDERITIPQNWNGGKSHIRQRGADFHSGDTLLKSGERLNAWRLSLAAAAGSERLTVAAKPRVALLCTGDELVPPGAKPRADQIYESTSYALRALIRDWGGKVQFLGANSDNLDELTRALDDTKADIIVTVGGASVGDYDLVKPALANLGMVWEFDKVEMRPGRPTAFGHLPDGRRVLNLPGNPGSALVCAQLFLKPFIERALGQPVPALTQVLTCAAALAANGPREAYLRARITTDAQGLPVLMPMHDQDSSMIQAFAHTDALIRRMAHAPATEAGALIDHIPLRR